MKAGIWLDNHKAYIVFISNGTENLIRINSEVEDFHVHGGAAAPTAYGTHDTVPERKYLERKKQQLNRYYNTLKQKVKLCDAIYICGPAEAKLGLKKEIMDDSILKDKLSMVESCDRMTENQIVAQVKAHYNK